MNTAKKCFISVVVLEGNHCLKHQDNASESEHDHNIWKIINHIKDLLFTNDIYDDEKKML